MKEVGLSRPSTESVTEVVYYAAANSVINKEDSVPRADGKGDEATSVVSATESDSGEATSLSAT